MSTVGPAERTPSSSVIMTSGFGNAATVQTIKVTLREFQPHGPRRGRGPVDASGQRPADRADGRGRRRNRREQPHLYVRRRRDRPSAGHGLLSSGTFKPTSHETVARSYPQFGIGTAYSLPGPAFGGDFTLADVFRGRSLNGAWNLIVRDFVNGDGGQFAGGWSLDVTSGFDATAGLGLITDGLSSCTAYGANDDVAIPVNGLTGVVDDLAISTILCAHLGGRPRCPTDRARGLAVPGDLQPHRR